LKSFIFALWIRLFFRALPDFVEAIAEKPDTLKSAPQSKAPDFVDRSVFVAESDKTNYLNRTWQTGFFPPEKQNRKGARKYP
jgi:hypothetical protein